MAFCGITINALTKEFNDKLLNGKIQRISQPEALGLVFTVHTESGNHKLYISANASLPLCYITKESKPSPLTAFNFVMVLRKHIGNARIIGIEQFGLERVIRIQLEHLDELKDVAKKYLYIEIMGKYSNIIFTDENNKIIDAIKHVGATQSSVREVLPGRDYFIPMQSDRKSLFDCDREYFYNKVLSRKGILNKVIASSFVGFSNFTGMELCNRAGIDGQTQIDTLHKDELIRLCDEFEKFKEAVENKSYSPMVVFNENDRPLEFFAFPITLYENEKKTSYESMSEAVFLFYQNKNTKDLIRQKAVDIKKLISNHIERDNKKLALWERQLNDTDKKDKLKLYGELLLTYGYSIEPMAKVARVENYYDNNNFIEIPLDKTLSAIDNSKKYYAKYEKLKRTKDALLPQIENTKNEIEHLSSIYTALEISETEEDLAAIRQELFEYGFIKKRPDKNKSKNKKNPPLHFVTADGFELYVGKNNFQNEEVTFKLARGEDWWFHAKQMPGSHVLLKNDGREIPDKVFEVAANLAAYYSSGRESTHLEVDYLQRKDIKRVNGAAKGFVIYYTNYSMTASPRIDSSLKET